MKIKILKSKIHNVKVTEANINYIGSVTIDENLMDAANIIAGEKVQVLNANNGERLETYVIKGNEILEKSKSMVQLQKKLIKAI